MHEYELTYTVDSSTQSVKLESMDNVIKFIDRLCKRHRRLIRCTLRPLGESLTYHVDFD